MSSVCGVFGRRKVAKIAAALRLFAALAGSGLHSAAAEEHEINAFAAQWMPLVLFIAPGDTVIWHGMTGHETELIDGMAPTGNAAWRSELGEEGFKVTLEQEGAYIYKCHTHMNAGMFGAIVVGEGEPRNLAAIEAALPDIGIGRAAVERLLARLKREVRLRSVRQPR